MDPRLKHISLICMITLIQPGSGQPADLQHLSQQASPNNTAQAHYQHLNQHHSHKDTNQPLTRRNGHGGWKPMPLPLRYGPAAPLFRHDPSGRPLVPRAMNFQPHQQRPLMFLPPPPQAQAQNQLLTQANAQKPAQAPLKLLRPSQPEPLSTSASVHLPRHVQGQGQGHDLRPSSQYGPPEPQPPKTVEEQSELRFLFHRPEDEEMIKSTIQEESVRYNERVSFIKGPTLKFQRRQTIYLPPRKKSVIYVMLKEPQVKTDLEIVEPAMDPTPEVNIIYEKTGPVRTKHYYSTSDKHAPGHDMQNSVGSASEIRSVSAVPPPAQIQHKTLPPPENQNEPKSNPCTPNFSKKLRK